MTNIIERKRNTVSNGFEMKPSNLAEAMEFAKIISESDICPKEHKGKPGNVLVAIQMGGEVGLSPLQAINSINVINGKPTIWGDAALALVVIHPAYEWHEEKVVQDPNGNHRAFSTIKRKGAEPHTYEFSVEDAKKAGLWGKAGAWTSYPKRMLQMRARGFVLRDKFPDALKGLSIREEVLDYEMVDGNMVQPIQEKKSDRLSDRLIEKLKKSQFYEEKEATEIIESVDVEDSLDLTSSEINENYVKDLEIESKSDKLAQMISEE